LAYILNESNAASYLLDKVDTDITSIKAGLKQLKFLNYHLIDQFSDELLVRHLSLYRAQKLDLKSITPGSVENPLAVTDIAELPGG
jgi:hypothetical protein